jgi:NDP-sugar pyrophosphorylase family protein
LKNTGDPKSDLTRTIVVLPCGGRGERLAELAEAKGVNKTAIRAGGRTLIERTIDLYTRIGIRKFVVLVFHRAGSIHRVLGNGKKLGISVAYSMDPKKAVGKGGAILHAMKRGIIPADSRIIVHNPDDQVVGIEKTFARRILAAHRSAVRKGALGTAVGVPSTEYPYTSLIVRKGMAVSARMYPEVPMPAHIGVTILEPAAMAAFRKLIRPGRKVDFESVVLPWLARHRRLGYAEIPAASWIPVNDLKSYRKLVALLEK